MQGMNLNLCILRMFEDTFFDWHDPYNMYIAKLPKVYSSSYTL